MKKTKNTAITIFFSVLICCLIGACTWQVTHETTAEKEKIVKSKELKQIGKELRKAIDEEYDRLADADELKIMGQGRNCITDVVVKYIPIGTSFDDAEAILRAAGFKVGKRYLEPLLFRKNGTSSIGSYSEIDNYKLLPLFANTSINVFLEPKSKNDWSTVQNLEATIAIIYL